MNGLDAFSRADGDPQLHGRVARLFHGVDFTSAPGPRKAIVVASGRLEAGALRLAGLERLRSLANWADWLQRPGPWAAGLDLPLGLPRELVEALGWPTDWAGLMRHYAAMSRPDIRERFRRFCAARPAGRKFAHRACDGPAGSSPAMKWVNPPVAFMLHAALPGLLAAGVDLPGLLPGDERRLALEAYPGLTARAVLGWRSYKSDDARLRGCPLRRQARQVLLAALCDGQACAGLALVLTPQQADELLEDASGDSLDAVICLMQIARASALPDWGWPAQVDRLEGWILGA